MLSPKGFTLLEVLLSIGLITVLAGLSLPVYQALQNRNDLDIATVTVAQTLRRAQLLSQAVDGDTNCGIKLQSGSVTLFKGTSYAARDASFDEVFDVPTSITQSGVGEVVFAKFTGMPQTTGTITLTSSTNEVRNLILNAKGTITY